jgi:hypothetical protein
LGGCCKLLWEAAPQQLEKELPLLALLALLALLPLLALLALCTSRRSTHRAALTRSRAAVSIT